MTKMKISDGHHHEECRRQTGTAPTTGFSALSTCAGRVRLRTVSMLAAKTSFHDMTKVKMAAAAMPGATSGSTTRAKGLQRRAAKDLRRLLQLVGNAGKDAADHQDGRGQGQRRVHQRQAVDAVVDPQADEDDGQRDRQDHHREGAHRQDRQPVGVAPPEDVARDGIARRRGNQGREHQRDQRHDDAVDRARDDALRAAERSASSRARRG